LKDLEKWRKEAAAAMPKADPHLKAGQLNLGTLIAAGQAAQKTLSRFGIGPVRVLNIATHRTRLVIEIQHFPALDAVKGANRHANPDGPDLMHLQIDSWAHIVWQAPKREG
jgi:hypothetical protein